VRALLVALTLLALRGLAAAEIRVSATIDPAKLAVGESADLAVAIDGTQSGPAPQIASPDGLQIQAVGPSTNVSIVNGRVTASVTHHFTVIASKAGRYTIGPFGVDVDGKHYDAPAVTLEALAAGARSGDGSPSRNDQLELSLSLPRTEVYLHERIPLGLKLLVGAVRIGDLQYPAVPGDGFALEKFPEPTQRREDTPNGPRQVVDFKTTLTPLKTGSLTIGPATMNMSVVVQGRRRGPFFGGFFGDETRPTQLQSQPITLTVLPLPSEGRPPDFGGAVGHFTFEVTAAPAEVTAGDPVTVHSVVRGDGALDGIAPPTIAGGDGFRTYPVQTSQPSDRNDERTFEQVVIPLRDGPFRLPTLRFSYFDPTSRTYRTIAPSPITLIVRPSAQAKATPQIVGAVPAPAPVPQRTETLGRDIVFIKDAPGTLRPVGARLYRSPVFWLLQLVPVLAWAAATTYDRRRRRLATDSQYARYTRAGREVRAALAHARDVLRRGDPVGCHDHVAAAVRDYLAAKLALPPGSVLEAAPQRLRTNGAGDAVATQVTAFFAACEAARFAPRATSASELETTLAQADAIVRALERSRRLGRAAAALALVVIAAGSIAAGPETPSALFYRASALYGEERYAEAAAVYEKILAAGVESAPVYFDLGNAWFKTGDVGRAVLAYERALRLAPGDPDLAANVAYARELASDVADEPIAARLLVPLASRASTDTLLVAAAVAWWVLWLALAVGPLLPGFARAPRFLVAAATLALVVSATSGGYRWSTIDHPTYAVVVASADATVRYEPNANAKPHFAAKPGTVLRVDGEQKGWSQVVGRDRRRGWIESSALGYI